MLKPTDYPDAWTDTRDKQLTASFIFQSKILAISQKYPT